MAMLPSCILIFFRGIIWFSSDYFSLVLTCIPGHPEEIIRQRRKARWLCRPYPLCACRILWPHPNHPTDYKCQGHALHFVVLVLWDLVVSFFAWFCFKFQLPRPARPVPYFFDTVFLHISVMIHDQRVDFGHILTAGWYIIEQTCSQDQNYNSYWYEWCFFVCCHNSSGF